MTRLHTAISNPPICSGAAPTSVAFLPVIEKAVPFTPTPTFLPQSTATPTHILPTITSVVPTPTTTSNTSASITSIHYAPSSTLAEYVEIKNTGGSTLTLTGWTVRDLVPHIFTFPSFTLAAGASVRVWTNSGTNDAANLYWGRGQAVWNNDGDTAILSDAQGQEISRYSYP